MNQAIEKAAAVIIKDKRLLLVSGNNQRFFWTPGGKLEPNESPEMALRRELKEELGIQITNLKPYFIYISEVEEDQKTRKVHNFLIEYSGNLIRDNEVDNIAWVSKNDFEQNTTPLQLGVRIHLIPRLISDNLL